MRIGFVRATLHVGGLWALAFAQPLLGLLGDEAGFFVARGSTSGDILLLALGYGLVPPLVAGAVVALVGRVSAGAGAALYLALIALLVAALVLPPAGDLLGGSGAAVVVALAAGGLAATAVARRTEASALLTALSPAPVVVVALFLVVSPAAELVKGGEASGAVGGPARSQTPILQVILDELPVTTIERADGRIDARRFPNLARLASDATWYRHATTTADSTLDAVPLQLTGLAPHVGDLPTSADHPRNLFTLFSRSHRLMAAEPITDLCPSRLCAEPTDRASVRLRALASDLSVIVRHQLLPADLTRGLPPIDRTWSGFTSASDGPISSAAADRQRSELGKAVGEDLRRRDDDGAVARLIRQLDRRGLRPPLVFAHLIVPHAPWRFLPDGRAYALHAGDPPGLSGKYWLPRRPDLAEQAWERHLLQAEYADALLGRLLDAFKTRGLYDRAVIVVTADHGSGFTAGESRRTVMPGNVGEIAGVPFFVKRPQQHQARVDDRAVRTVDVLPTIARAAGVRVPWRTDGRPADERPVDPQARIEVTHAGAPGTATTLAAILATQRRRNTAEERLLARPIGAGPRPDLLGRLVPATALVGAGGPRATVEAGRLLIAGRLQRLEAPALLAVAVDGRIRATTRAYPESDGWRYQALLPPPGARRASRITVLQVLPGGRLRRIGGT